MTRKRGTGRWLAAMAVFAIAFGLLTLKEGLSVLLDIGDARSAAGAYVPFVLWFNVAAGLAYVAAGVGLWRRRPWAARLAVVIAVATAAVFAALGLHVGTGGAYELRTVAAMTLRTVVWTLMAAAACRMLGCRVANS